MYACRIPFSLVVIAILGFGCHKDDPYVGTWKSTYTEKERNFEITQTNSADGTYTTHARVSKDGSNRALLVDDRGTWKKLSDTSVEERLVDTNWTGREGGTADAKAKEARFTKKKARIISDANKQPTKSLKWDGGDQYTESESGHSITFHRSS